MPCWRACNDRCDVVGKNKIFMKRSIEDEIKMMFGVSGSNTFKGFKHKPANTFEVVML